MVTKQDNITDRLYKRSVLAKILMVTKLWKANMVKERCSVLAKILMVTKRALFGAYAPFCSVLAKILMVTKH